MVLITGILMVTEIFAHGNSIGRKFESKNYPVLASKKYSRIASMTLGGDEMILSLVSPDRIVGLSGKINKDREVSNVPDTSKGFPEIEGNIEVVMDLDPDLIITADWVKREFLMQLEDIGVDTYIYHTPNSWEEQIDVICELAHLVRADRRGEQIVNDMEDRLLALQAKIRENYHGEKPNILLYTSMETTNGKNTLFDSIAHCILSNNIAADEGITGYTKISKEKVIEMNPDIIVVPLWNKHPDNEKFISFIKNDKSFQEVKAVKEGKVYAIPYRYISTTSQYMIDGIEKLAEKIYGLK